MTKTETRNGKVRALLVVLLAGFVLAGFVGLNRFRVSRTWACPSNSIELALVPSNYAGLPKETKAQLVDLVAKTRGRSEADVRTQLQRIWTLTTYEWLQPETKTRISENLKVLRYEGVKPKLEVVRGAIRIGNQSEMLPSDVTLTIGGITSSAGSSYLGDGSLAASQVDQNAIHDFGLASACTDPDRIRK
jgi:hypothetical protein